MFVCTPGKHVYNEINIKNVPRVCNRKFCNRKITVYELENKINAYKTTK